jgi:DNA uptake protein ComE-like DNA-binding protein
MAGNDDVMGYTHRGQRWEYRQSWYMLALFTPWTFWFPLLYTGIRTLQFRWIIWGLFYGLPSFIRMKFDPADFGLEEMFKRWLFTSMVLAAIHAFRARAEFLVRLANYIETRELLMEGARLRREQLEADAGSADASQEDRETEGEQVHAHESSHANVTPAPAPIRRLFDVNFIGERELAMLPGMGPERAKQAVAMRQTLGSFNSFDHFAEKMGLSAAARERLRPIFIQPAPAFETNDEYTTLADGRRILEINLASAQAIATLPGLTQDNARRAVALRDADGWYRSTEDFRYRLGLSMDTMVHISEFVSTVRTSGSRPGGKDGGRLVDSGSSSASSEAAAVRPSGRIVDL